MTLADTGRVPLRALIPDIPLSAENADIAITGVTADSRRVTAGSCFLAVAGIGRHGADFIPQAVAAGAACILIDADTDCPKAAIPVIVVCGLRRQQGEIAARFHGQPSQRLSISGVTGTNGKTSVSFFVASALEALSVPAAVIGTTGWGRISALQPLENTTPGVTDLHAMLKELTIAGCRAVVMEASSHGIEQGRLDAIQMRVAIFTNLSRDHLDYHGDMTTYRAAKAGLLKQPGLHEIVLNFDDPAIASLASECPPNVNVWGFTQDSAATNGPRTLRLLAADYHAGGMRLSWQLADTVETLDANLMGTFNAANLMAAACALCASGYSLTAATRALAQAKPPAGRMQVLKLAAAPTVIVDYAHTPDAVAQVLAGVAAHGAQRIWCVLGCGGDRDKGKRPQMARAALAGADNVVLTADNPRSEDPSRIIADMCEGLSPDEEPVAIIDRARAIQYVIDAAAAEDVVVVAGKGHERYQEIGGQRFAFDDVAVAEAALAQRVQRVS